jgi:hypothetical protein
MKRPTVVAVLLFVALGAGVEARDLPTPISPVSRHKTSNFTAYVRGTRRKLPEPIHMGRKDRRRSLRLTHSVRGK